MNLMLNTDAYKQTHYMMYPPDAEYVYMYTESRGVSDDAPPGAIPVFFGLQYTIQKYLEGKVITDDGIEQADMYCQAIFGKNYFNRGGFEYILDEHGGRLPLEIKAVPEGTRVPTHNVMFTTVNTDPKLPWLPGFVESVLLKVWYPIAVATYSAEIRRLIESAYVKAGDKDPYCPCALNDFGLRGASSLETAMIGGAAHMLSFRGTDNMPAMKLLADYYGGAPQNTGLSVAAAEHSVVTSWTNESDAYRNILETFPKDAVLAIVSDSYDIENAVKNIYGKELANNITARDGTLVVRPDSGDPVEMSINVIKMLKTAFGGRTDTNGFFTLNDAVRVIYGDGINYDSISSIMDKLIENKLSPDNIIFGLGGALLQNHNRDTYQMANKCSAIKVNGEWRDVFKNPKGCQSKASKRGRFKLVDDRGTLRTRLIDDPGTDIMRTVFKDGKLITFDNYSNIIERMWNE